MSKIEFDPNDIGQADMDQLADCIETYLDELEEVMVIPREIEQAHGKEIREAIKVSRKLVKKLRKGKKSVFKDPDEVNMFE